MEGEAPGFREAGLFWRFWGPEVCWAHLFLVHGLGEHSGRYEPLARWLGKRGIALFAFDLRGHGRSRGPRGDAAAFQDLLDDVSRMETVCADVVEEAVSSPGPRILFGHSLGGLIALRRLQSLRGPENPYAGAVLSAPWLATPVPEWLTALGRFLGWLAPWAPVPTDLAPEKLTRDPEKIQEWKDDALVHTRLTGRLFREVNRAQSLCLAGVEALKETPLLFLVPERDPVVSSAKTLEFTKGIDDRDLRVEILRARRHEALNDLGADEVYELIHSWVRYVVDSQAHKTISDR